MISKQSFFLGILLSISIHSSAQLFKPVSIEGAGNTWGIESDKFRTYTIQETELRSFLSSAPKEDLQFYNKGVSVPLPHPDGRIIKYNFVECSIMDRSLSNKYPEIHTYRGISEDKRSAITADITYAGFHAMITSPEGVIFIEPLPSANNAYISFFKSDVKKSQNLSCAFEPGMSSTQLFNKINSPKSKSATGINLQTYRLALAATGEYSVNRGGTKAKALSAMVTSVNRVDGIYEKEIAVRLILIGNTDTLIFLNGNTDPYTNNDGTIMLSENQKTVDSLIGNANYDIGHVFSTGGGGIAYRGVPCLTGLKAHGVTGSPTPFGDAFDVDYVAHEMGHQVGANHTFNSLLGSCGGNGNGATAFEPGSGSTIMAYAGICSTDDLQAHSDPYFNIASLDEITNYMVYGSGSTCPVVIPTSNNPPIIMDTIGNSIPAMTPFYLTGNGSDPDGDPITYCWEEVDAGPFGPVGSPSGQAAIFRSFNPNTTPVRVFPKMSSILAGTTVKGEKLPTYNRDLSFSLTIRDNKIGGGGVTHMNTPLALNVVNTGAPFRVSYPNSTNVISNKSLLTLTWDVSGTDQSPISCSAVSVFLSIDGGLTWPYLLADSTANDGTESVTLPDTITSKARIMVRAKGNIFFDVSDKNFTINNTVTSITEIEAEKLEVFPNPSGGEFHFRLPVNDHKTRIRCQVYNAIGGFVKEIVAEGRNEVAFDLDMSGAEAGVYLAKVEIDGRVLHKKLYKIQ